MAPALFNANNSIMGPYANAAAVTPNDSTDLTFRTRALYVGVTGNIVVSIGGSNVTFSNVPVGYHLLVVDRVLATGTTATNIVALW